MAGNKPKYYFPGGSKNCPKGNLIVTAAECMHACAVLNRSFNGRVSHGLRPAGCYWEGGSESYFNTILDPEWEGSWAGGICTTMSPEQQERDFTDIVRNSVSPTGPPTGPSGVRLPDGWKGPWDGPGWPEDPATATYGFYFPVYNQIAPVLEVVRAARKFYPDSPIHLMSDGGMLNFSAVCRLDAYGCTFERLAAENSRWNPHSWMTRMRDAALRLGTTYVIYLEPDVLVRGRHRHAPQHDAGGIYDNFNAALHQETSSYMQANGRKVNPCFKLRWRHFGLAGGSYFRTAALLDAFDPANVARIDFGAIATFETKRVFSSDLAMHVALSVRGYTVYPWREAAQFWKELNYSHDSMVMWPAVNPDAAFEHNHKETYNDPVPKVENSLMTVMPPVDETTCQGCIWFTKRSKETGDVPVLPPGGLRMTTENRFGLEAREREGPALEDRCFQAGTPEAVPMSL